MIRGIDVSSHDGWSNGRFGRANTEAAYGQSDFVIAKATEGTGYVNPYCDKAVQRARSDGKLWGFYHYCRGGNAVAEADYMYNQCKNYFGHGIPCIDWEAGTNRSWGDSSYVRKLADRIHALSGVWPMIYVQASALNQVGNCASDCALWVAGYPDMRNSWDVPTYRYGTGRWKTWTLWQFTSGGNTDRNVAQLTSDGWHRLAGGSSGGNAVSDTYAGWLQDAHGWWWRERDGSYPKSCWKKVGDEWYHFGDDGYMSTGWVYDDCRWYFCDKTRGNMLTGWQLIDGAWYYLDAKGAAVTGEYTMQDGKEYFFDENSCKMRCGVIQHGDTTIVTDSSGRVCARLTIKDGSIVSV